MLVAVLVGVGVKVGATTTCTLPVESPDNSGARPVLCPSATVAFMSKEVWKLTPPLDPRSNIKTRVTGEAGPTDSNPVGSVNDTVPLSPLKVPPPPISRSEAS